MRGVRESWKGCCLRRMGGDQAPGASRVVPGLSLTDASRFGGSRIIITMARQARGKGWKGCAGAWVGSAGEGDRPGQGQPPVMREADTLHTRRNVTGC